MSHIYEGVHVSFGIVNPLVVGSRNQVQSLTVNIEHILVCVCYSLCPSFMENVPCPSCYDGYSGNVLYTRDNCGLVPAGPVGTSIANSQIEAPVGETPTLVGMLPICLSCEKETDGIVL